MNPSLFEEYNNNEDIKPIFSIGNYVIGKYQKKEVPLDIVAQTTRDYFDRIHVPMLDEYLRGECDKYGKPKKKRGITNERQQILEDIRTIINQERKDSKEKKKYPPITGRALAIKLSHVPTEDLYATLSMGKDYKKRGKGEFGKFLFGSLKVKK